MMRTIEILFVIVIMMGAFLIASFFATLPSPHQVSPLNLRRLALTTMQTLDVDYDLSNAVFKPLGDPAWSKLQMALSASLPPNIVYNLTVAQITTGQEKLYSTVTSISNAANFGMESDAASYLAASSNVTYNAVPQKIGENGGGGTLYILNCSDANGWWITGYTAQELAGDLYNMLSPYFLTTVMVQNTSQLERMLNNASLQGETLQNAVVINTFGESVPMPAGYYSSSGVGYDTTHTSYALYSYAIGQKVRLYNWTWASIVGWPFYYVSNTLSLSSSQNSWGIYGMVMVSSYGLEAFLQGLDGQTYSYSTSSTSSIPGYVSLSSNAQSSSNYYGIYPSPNQTSTRALNGSVLSSQFHLTVSTYIFDPAQGSLNAGALYGNAVSGRFLALGLTRTPDIRLTALGLLSDYAPRIHPSEYTVNGTSRLVVLQLGLAGGV
jgi:hypothetical protein